MDCLARFCRFLLAFLISYKTSEDSPSDSDEVIDLSPTSFSLGFSAVVSDFSLLGTDHSQNPSAITYIKSPKENIHCADRVYL